MLRKFVKVSLIFSIMFMLLNQTVFAAVVGDSLSQPESGWTRYDDNNNFLVYSQQIKKYTNLSSFYNGTVSLFESTTIKNVEALRFKFSGTKIRLISYPGPSRANDVRVVIDGVSENMNLAAYDGAMKLVYEKTGLSNQAHEVVIYSGTNGTYTTFILDAIDLESSGALLDPSTTIPVPPLAPTDILANAGDGQVLINWSSVSNASSFVVKRSTTPGGPYTAISGSVTGTTFTDLSVINGTTYYYVVVAVNADGESVPSNEVSATPIATVEVRALLTLYLANGQVKEYDLSAAQLDSFLDWFDARAEGTGPARYGFDKTWNKGPFNTRTEYVIFNRIDTFDVDEYEVVPE